MLHWCVHRLSGHDETQHCTKVFYQLCGTISRATMLHWCVRRLSGHDETQHCTKVFYQLCGKTHHKAPSSQTEA